MHGDQAFDQQDRLQRPGIRLCKEFRQVDRTKRNYREILRAYPSTLRSKAYIEEFHGRRHGFLP